jgi:hypothetical protein
VPTKTRQLLVALVAIAILFSLVLLALTLSNTPPRPALPAPNGYDDFVKAGQALAGSGWNLPDLDHDRLRALLSTNAEALRLLRVGLTRQCSVPADSIVTNFARMLDDLRNLRRLAGLLVKEGQLREMENRPADAALCYVQAVQLGNEASRGGVIENRTTGLFCEGWGCVPLAKLVPSLDGDQARPVLEGLLRIENSRVTWDEVWRNDRRLVRHDFARATGPIAWLEGVWGLRQLEQFHQESLAAVSLLATELALRCYRSDQNKAPARLDELVPNYLTRVPQDPFGAKPLIYRPQGTNWVLYSVGPDGVDDGGKPLPQRSARGDFFFDSPR